MGKRILNIYIEDGDIELAKAQRINLSAFFRECLNLEMVGRASKIKHSEKELLRLANNKIALLSAELVKSKDQISKLEAKLSKVNDPLDKVYARR